MPGCSPYSRPGFKSREWFGPCSLFSDESRPHALGEPRPMHDVGLVHLCFDRNGPIADSGRAEASVGVFFGQIRPVPREHPQPPPPEHRQRPGKHMHGLESLAAMRPRYPGKHDPHDPGPRTGCVGSGEHIPCLGKDETHSLSLCLDFPQVRRWRLDGRIVFPSIMSEGRFRTPGRRADQQLPGTSYLGSRGRAHNTTWVKRQPRGQDLRGPT